MRSTAGTIILITLLTIVLLIGGGLAIKPLRDTIRNNAIQQTLNSKGERWTQIRNTSTRVGIINGLLIASLSSFTIFLDIKIWKRHKRLKNYTPEADNHSEVEVDDDFIYYCNSCGSVLSGPQDLEKPDLLCPNCGNTTTLTDISVAKWENMSSFAQATHKKIWKNQISIEEPLGGTDEIDDPVADIHDGYEEEPAKQDPKVVSSITESEKQLKDDDKQKAEKLEDETAVLSSAPVHDEIKSKLLKIKDYYESGLITEGEYEKKRLELISRI